MFFKCINFKGPLNKEEFKTHMLEMLRHKKQRFRIFFNLPSTADEILRQNERWEEEDVNHEEEEESAEEEEEDVEYGGEGEDNENYDGGDECDP